MSARPAYRIPADIERDDRLLLGLTARQLAILAATGTLAGGLCWLARQLVPAEPAALLAALALPIAAAGLALALGRRDGLPLDLLALAAIRQIRAPRRRVPAPEGVPAAPAWLPADPGPLPAPLELPAFGIDPDGVVDLGPDGAVVLCSATSVNLGLRTETEQEALVAAFGRFLHALTGPVQILVRAEPVDLTPVIRRLDQDASGLPHPALEAAARDHTRFLAALAARRDVLRREILVVFREPPAPGATTALGRVALRHASESGSLLAAAGVTLTPLDGAAATAALARAARPGRQPAHNRPEVR
jgi:hypothetical protein